MNGGDLLLQLLQNYGIEHIFCSPGSEWVPVWENLVQRYDRGDRQIKYINCRDETLAISAAIGYAKYSQKLSALLFHANVGPLHGAMAMRAALVARAPMIIFSAYTSNYGDYEGNRSWETHWISHLSDIGGPAALIKPYVKWSNTVTSEKMLEDSITRGCRIANTSPRGPVFLAVPRELMAKNLGDVSYCSKVNIQAKTQPVFDDLIEIARLIVESENPIILTEYAGENQEAMNRLVELAETLSIPVFESAKPIFSNFPKTHPLYQGNNARDALNLADMILVVGAATPWFPPSAHPKNGTKVIVVDEDPSKMMLPYHGYRSDFIMEGDIEQSLSQLIAAIRDCVINSIGSTSIYGDRMKINKAKHNQMAEQSIAAAEGEKTRKPISSKWFLYLANKMIPENSINIVETITHSHHLYRYLTASTKFYRCSDGGLGGGMGIAIGAKIGSPNDAVIYYVGDGSFNYGPILAGLGLCQEYQVPIMTIILNNKSYAAMRAGYRSHFPKGWAVTHKSYLGVDINPQPDYVKIAEAFNAYGEKIENPDSIEPALKRAVQNLVQGKSVLLDVVTA